MRSQSLLIFTFFMAKAAAAASSSSRVEMSSSTADIPPTANLVFPTLIKPVLTQLEQRDANAAKAVKSALSKMEATHPGFCFDLVHSLLHKGQLHANINEGLLRTQGSMGVSERETPFRELNRRSAALKAILASIPDEISDRKAFLETIKEIAGAIKGLLEAVNEVSSGRRALEQKKREFVKYSKRFSETLKEFFKDGEPDSVFISAVCLIRQIDQLMITVKENSDQ